LKQHGPIMRRVELEDLCMESGIKRSTFFAYLEYSPVIEKFASGVFGLRGAQASPGLIESLIPERRQTRVLVDHGWTEDGRIWIVYQLSEGMLGGGAFSVPSSVKRFLQGTFVLKAEDGAVMGNLVLKDNNGWGLSPFFRRRGGDPGDHLLLHFNLSSKEVLIRIGDESLVEEYQSSQLTDNFTKQ
jgi:hypothetical protein